MRIADACEVNAARVTMPKSPSPSCETARPAATAPTREPAIAAATSRAKSSRVRSRGNVCPAARTAMTTAGSATLLTPSPSAISSGRPPSMLAATETGKMSARTTGRHRGSVRQRTRTEMPAPGQYGDSVSPVAA